MLRKFFAGAITVCLLSCGGGKHEPIQSKDSIAGTVSGNTPMGATDSTNGAVVTPIDTAGSARRDPAH